MTGKPENEEGFTEFTVEDDIKIYVDNEVLNKLDPGAKELKFMVPEYGWQHLTFEQEG
ncbi:hypothetical protein [Biomaibacter acetigenes]|uniref:hypothetical protein n=1 Tax=Biomaibacter acetigenes TaxID=2316383 RepID=UPI0013CEE858|nr:hypothetical protein [Biomaibacter acetigenes]